jgi:hypothetical protein
VRLVADRGGVEQASRTARRSRPAPLRLPERNPNWTIGPHVVQPVLGLVTTPKFHLPPRDRLTVRVLVAGPAGPAVSDDDLDRLDPIVL